MREYHKYLFLGLRNKIELAIMAMLKFMKAVIHSREVVNNYIRYFVKDPIIIPHMNKYSIFPSMRCRFYRIIMYFDKNDHKIPY